ncbi:MAG: hypothetical protein A2X86_18705 [Bdellovibrionales bacterium GWA2_49_15]|nr:MAG: hypothetical protein A2X86_18705 [Bdellovibrionales bacterium GWA2_49_15]
MPNQLNPHHENPAGIQIPRIPKKVRGERSREKKIAELTQLAQTLDPYKGPTKQESKILKKYGITEFADPFLLTNQVLLLLENAIENTSYELKNS